MNILKRTGHVVAVSAATLAVAFAPLTAAAATADPGGAEEPSESLNSEPAEPVDEEQVAPFSTTGAEELLEEAALESADEPSPILICAAPVATKYKVGVQLTLAADCVLSGDYVYEWHRIKAGADGEVIPGALEEPIKTIDTDKQVVGNTYKLTYKEQGYRVFVRAVAAGEPVWESELTPRVEAGELVSAIPTISGAAKVGQQLKANAGKWSAGTKLIYRWYVNGELKKSGDVYAVGAADVNKNVVVKVTGYLLGYPETERESAPVKITTGSLARSKPTITGTPKVGETLTANPGTWTSGTAFTYQWYAGTKAIKGATGKTLKLATAQVNKTIKVKVRGTNPGYAAYSVTSAVTAKVVTNSSTVTGSAGKGDPSFSGVLAAGNTLTANPGSWAAGTSFSYQWYACGNKISGATSRSYRIPSGILESNSILDCRIKVNVTGKKGSKSSTKASATRGVSWRVSTGTQMNLRNVKNLNILVDIPSQRVHVKSGTKTVYSMKTSTGLPGKGTPKGSFKTSGRKGLKFTNSGGIGARWWTNFYGNHTHFHSVPFDRTGYYSAWNGERLGTRQSSGCVRLPVADAKWFYNQLPKGTKVVVK